MMRRRPREARVRDELAARRDPPSSGARSTRDASLLERRIERTVFVVRLVCVLLVLPAFGVAAVLLVGPGSDVLGALCIGAGLVAGWLAMDPVA